MARRPAGTRASKGRGALTPLFSIFTAPVDAAEFSILVSIALAVLVVGIAALVVGCVLMMPKVGARWWQGLIPGYNLYRLFRGARAEVLLSAYIIDTAFVFGYFFAVEPEYQELIWWPVFIGVFMIQWLALCLAQRMHLNWFWQVLSFLAPSFAWCLIGLLPVRVDPDWYPWAVRPFIRFEHAVWGHPWEYDRSDPRAGVAYFGVPEDELGDEGVDGDEGEGGFGEDGLADGGPDGEGSEERYEDGRLDGGGEPMDGEYPGESLEGDLADGDDGWSDDGDLAGDSDDGWDDGDFADGDPDGSRGELFEDGSGVDPEGRPDDDLGSGDEDPVGEGYPDEDFTDEWLPEGDVGDDARRGSDGAVPPGPSDDWPDEVRDALPYEPQDEPIDEFEDEPLDEPEDEFPAAHPMNELPVEPVDMGNSEGETPNEGPAMSEREARETTGVEPEEPTAAAEPQEAPAEDRYEGEAAYRGKGFDPEGDEAAERADERESADFTRHVERILDEEARLFDRGPRAARRRGRPDDDLSDLVEGQIEGIYAEQLGYPGVTQDVDAEEAAYLEENATYARERILGETDDEPDGDGYVGRHLASAVRKVEREEADDPDWPEPASDSDSESKPGSGTSTIDDRLPKID